MRMRLVYVGLSMVIALLAVFAAQPYFEHAFYAQTAPRSIEPRGSLSDSEQSAIAIFERVSPSVVQVAARTEASNQFTEDTSRAATGTGFVWDSAGHIVTNHHVV